jgi:succinoglycan biosynthesis transport protein ExoP
MRSELVAEVKNKGNIGSQPASGNVARDVADASQNSPVLQLQGQLLANQAEITNREQAIAGLKLSVSEYQTRLNQEPVREQQLADLNRGYDQSKANYDDLLKKESESKMATSMEHMQQGERFRMLDPPSFPLKPDFPKRLQFCGIGLGFGLMLGIVAAGGFEFMDDRLHSVKAIKALLPIKVISEIPEVQDPSDDRGNKNRLMLGWAMAVVVFATIMAGSLFSYRHS